MGGGRGSAGGGGGGGRVADQSGFFTTHLFCFVSAQSCGTQPTPLLLHPPALILLPPLQSQYFPFPPPPPSSPPPPPPPPPPLPLTSHAHTLLTRRNTPLPFPPLSAGAHFSPHIPLSLVCLCVRVKVNTVEEMSLVRLPTPVRLVKLEHKQRPVFTYFPTETNERRFE